jgi:hypothetical protein
MPTIHNLVKKLKPKRPLYVQIAFTLFSFLLMVVLGYVLTSNIVHGYLLQNTENVFISVQAKIMSDLLEPQITLDNFARTVRNMILTGDNAVKVKEYYNSISDYLSLIKESLGK